MLKYLDDLDKTKPKLSKLAMFPGFNIIDVTNNILNEPLTYNNEFDYKNSVTLDKTTINENIFLKLYGLIDTQKKQLTKKSRKKPQRKLTRKH
jgi:7,8-dihydro-6-hydroxymethylpterin-pyrophosphokinase